MLRALLWKEWREQRALLATGVALAVTLPLLLFVVATVTLPRVSGQRLVDATMLAFALMLWPLFVAGAGAGTFANEATGNTAGFLLSRPISRARVWLIKIALAAGAALAVVTVSLLVAQLLQWWVGTQGAVSPSLVLLRGDLDATESLLLGAPSLYLCFSAAAFLSARVARPLAAAIGALVTSIVLLLAIILLSGRVGLVSAVAPWWIAAEVSVLATALLALSLRRFARSEPLATGSMRRTLATVALVFLGTGAVGFLPAAYAVRFTHLDRAVTRELALSPDGGTAVVTAAPWPAMFGSLWRLPDRAGQAATGEPAPEPVRLSRRLAFSPFFSADGEWVYYFAARSFVGVVGGRVDLWRVRIDGSEEQRIGESIAEITDTRRGWPEAADSPTVSRDGRWVAFASGWWGREPLVLDLLSGTGRLVTDLAAGADSVGTAYGAPIAWTESGALLFRVWRYPTGESSGRLNAIVRYDVESGQATTLMSFRSDAADWNFDRFYPPRHVLDAYAPGARLPVQVHLRERSQADSFSNGYWQLAVVDVDSGVVRIVESFPCSYPGAAASADGAVLAYWRYTRCERDEGGELMGVGPSVVVRDLVSGASRGFVDPFVDFPEVWVSYLALSPSGRRASMQVDPVSGEAGGYRILEADGSTRPIDLRRTVRGQLRGPQTAPSWLDEDHLLLRYRAPYRVDNLPFGAVVIMNVNDGSVVHEFVIPPTDRNVY